MLTSMRITLENESDNFAVLKATASRVADSMDSEWTFKKAKAYQTKTGRAIDLNFDQT